MNVGLAIKHELADTSLEIDDNDASFAVHEICNGN